MKIIVINGQGGSGKDSLVNSMAAFADSTTTIFNESTITLIKDLASKLGWNGVKDEKGRRFLSDLKDAFTRYNDLPYEKLKEQLKRICFELRYWQIPTKNCFIFIHCREPKEIDRIKEEFHAKSLLILRNSLKDYGNHADNGVLNESYDYILENDGSLADWTATAVKFMEQLKNESWYSYNLDELEIWDMPYEREDI